MVRQLRRLGATRPPPPLTCCFFVSDKKKQIRKKPLNFIGLNNKKKLSRVNSSENISNHSTNIISVSEGDKVEHERFGIGVVIKIEGSGGNKSALINFKNSGSKKLLLRFAKLSPIK